MPRITEADLKKQIKNKSFSPVYLIYGSEQMFVKSYTKKLCEAVAGKNPSDFNYHTFITPERALKSSFISPETKCAETKSRRASAAKLKVSGRFIGCGMIPNSCKSS